MNNPFSQSKVTYRIDFKINFKHIEIFEQLLTDHFGEDVLSISTEESFSQTIESKPEDVWNISFYLKVEPNITHISSLLEEFTKCKNIKIYAPINLEKIEDCDWVELYQRQLKPIETEKFFISAEIHRELCPEDKIGIYINASRAFGTGDHATTISCVEALTKLSDSKIISILDLGTGTGILSFVAEHIWPLANVFACDIEEVAVKIACENGNFNDSKVNFYINSEDNILVEQYFELKFDLIVANILANPLIGLSSQIKSALNPGGYIILSGFLDYQADEVTNCFCKSGFKVIDIISKGSWITITLKL
ncbi:MAG: 50S ribosomal protein L11 methyltransferase [Janthinobacterium lividum]